MTRRADAAVVSAPVTPRRREEVNAWTTTANCRTTAGFSPS